MLDQQLLVYIFSANNTHLVILEDIFYRDVSTESGHNTGYILPFCLGERQDLIEGQPLAFRLQPVEALLAQCGFYWEIILDSHAYPKPQKIANNLTNRREKRQ